MSVTAFHFIESELQQLLEGPDGPVAAMLGQKAIRVTNQARVNASGRPGPNVRTGRLRSSIAWELGKDSDGLFADIGSNVPYARPLETGLKNGARYPFLVPALSAI